MKRKKEVSKLYQYGNDVILEFVVLNRQFKEIAKKFNCGNDHIDHFVKNSAFKDKETVTYAAIDNEKKLIVAILTIVASGIYTNPSIMSGRKETVLSAIEIKNFAVDLRYQKIPYSDFDGDETLSYQIFNKYLKDLLELSRKVIGAKKIILYSVDDAVKFYKKHGFKDFRIYMARDQRREVKGCKPMYFNLN